MPNNVSDETIREWLATKEVIKSFIKELRPDLSEDHLDHNAAAVIARLAQHQPPILCAFMGSLLK